MIGPAVYHSDYSGLTCPTPLRTTGAMNPLHRGHAQLLHQALAYQQRLQSWETWRDRKTMKILAFQAVQTTRCGSLQCVPTGICALMCTCKGWKGWHFGIISSTLSCEDIMFTVLTFDSNPSAGLYNGVERSVFLPRTFRIVQIERKNQWPLAYQQHCNYNTQMLHAWNLWNYIKLAIHPKFIWATAKTPAIGKM